MFSCRRIFHSTSPKCASQLSPRYIGIQKQKTTTNVKKKKNVQSSKTTSNKSSVSKTTKSKIVFRDIYANISHSCNSPVLASLTSEVGHEVYSRFCMNTLRNYGFNLQLSDCSKKNQTLTGDWVVPGHKKDIIASCTFQRDDLKDHSAMLKRLSQDTPPETVALFINSVGFKGEFVKNFVRSDKPCILMSISDSSYHWLSQQNSYWKYREPIDKCLHHQIWENDIDFSTYKFATYRVSIPRYSIQQGMSLLLFNKAFISSVPSLSAGKYIYQWPQNLKSKRKRLLKTYFYSTVLIDTEEGKQDLSDVLHKEKQRELELYYQTQMKNYYESKGKDVSIGQYISGVSEQREDEKTGEVCHLHLFNELDNYHDEALFSDDSWSVH